MCSLAYITECACLRGEIGKAGGEGRRGGGTLYRLGLVSVAVLRTNLAAPKWKRSFIISVTISNGQNTQTALKLANDDSLQIPFSSLLFPRHAFPSSPFLVSQVISTYFSRHSVTFCALVFCLSFGHSHTKLARFLFMRVCIYS
jgi:hypothetical protein